MDLKKFKDTFYEHPFQAVDELDLSFKIRGQDFNLNLFQKWKKLRWTALGVVIGSLILWILLGFDSTPLQFIHALYEVPNWILGSGTLQDVFNSYNFAYGKEMHYSAFVIYGGVFYILSKHFEKELGWIGSKNIGYSSAIVFLNIAFFEIFWMYGFATFQNQSWAVTFAWPQARIHLQNIGFLLVGFLVVLYMWIDSHVIEKYKDGSSEIVARLYSFRADWKALALILLTVASALIWIYYPGPVTSLSVELESGEIWTNSRLFPQTLYTIDLNPEDSVNAGVWFWVEDNFIHGLNTYVKAVWALTFLYLFKVKKIE